MHYEVLAILGWVMLSAYFSGAETGFYSLNRLRLHVRVSEKHSRAVLVSKLLENPNSLLATLLIGTNITVYFATTTLVGVWTKSGLPHPEIYCTMIMAPLLLILAEIIPKNLFRERADTAVYKVAGITGFFCVVFSPLVKVFSWIGKIVTVFLRRRKKKGQGLEGFWSRSQFRHIIEEGTREGVLSGYQNHMAKNIMHIRQVPVEKVMVPLNKVYAINEDASLMQLFELVKRRGRGRFPIYSSEMRNITGIVNVFDYFYNTGPGERGVSYDENAPVNTLRRPAVTFFRNTPLDSVFFLLQHARQQMGIVLDEQRQAVGIITMTDIIDVIIAQ